MNPVSIAHQAIAHQGALPSAQIRAFVRREAGMVCPRVAVLEPEKVSRHARMLMEGTYDYELARLSAEVELAGGERNRVFQRLTGRSEWPLRWSWGGFNALRFAPLTWLRQHFAAYWKKAELIDQK